MEWSTFFLNTLNWMAGLNPDFATWASGPNPRFGPVQNRLKLVKTFTTRTVAALFRIRPCESLSFVLVFVILFLCWLWKAFCTKLPGIAVKSKTTWHLWPAVKTGYNGRGNNRAQLCICSKKCMAGVTGSDDLHWIPSPVTFKQQFGREGLLGRGLIGGILQMSHCRTYFGLKVTGGCFTQGRPKEALFWHCMTTCIRMKGDLTLQLLVLLVCQWNVRNLPVPKQVCILDHSFSGVECTFGGMYNHFHHLGFQCYEFSKRNLAQRLHSRVTSVSAFYHTINNHQIHIWCTALLGTANSTSKIPHHESFQLIPR